MKTNKSKILVYMLLLACLCSWVSATELYTDLFLHLKTDANADDSYGSEDFDVTGAVLSTDYVLGNGSYYFDGGDHLNRTTSVLMNVSTTCFWVKSTDNSTSKIVANFYKTGAADEVLRIVMDNTQKFDLMNDYGVSSLDKSSFANNTWYHLCAIINESGAYLYQNASLIASDTTITDCGTALELKFGERYDNAADHYGNIDDIAIWTRALNETEISQLYNSGDGLPYELSLYANKSHPSCNDANTRGNSSINNPFCSIDSAVDVAECGDEIYITHNSTDQYYEQVTAENILCEDNPIIITAYEDDSVNVTHLDAAFSVANGLWTKVYNGNGNMYVASHNVANTWTTVHYPNGSQLPPYETLAALNDTDNPEGSFSDNTNNLLYLKINSSYNPNSSMIIAEEDRGVFYIADSFGVEIHNLTVKYSKRNIWVHDSSNITINNNEIIGCSEHCVYLHSDSSDVDGCIVSNNNIQNDWHPGVWWELIKTGGTGTHVMEKYESNGVYGYQIDENNQIYNNVINGTFNGIYIYNPVTDRDDGTQVYGNNISWIFDDGLETESYTSNQNWSNNIVVDAYIAASFAAPNCTGQCYFTYNILNASRDIPFNSPTDTDNGSTFKWGQSDTRRITNWVIDHNTCYSNSQVFYGFNTDVVHDTNITNNIFMNIGSSALLYKIGLSASGLYMNHNLYYTKDTAVFANDWNNGSGASYATLDLAKASSDWDGTWDINSTEDDPLLDSNYEPASNSPACTMSSTGSYVGAFPCSSSYSDNVNPDLTFNSPTSQTYNDTLTVTLNATCSDNVNIKNISIYRNGTIIVTNSSVINNTPWVYEMTMLDYSNYSIYYVCNDNNSNSNTSGSRWYNFQLATFTYTLTVPLPQYNPSSSMSASLLIEDYLGAGYESATVYMALANTSGNEVSSWYTATEIGSGLYEYTFTTPSTEASYLVLANATILTTEYANTSFSVVDTTDVGGSGGSSGGGSDTDNDEEEEDDEEDTGDNETTTDDEEESSLPETIYQTVTSKTKDIIDDIKSTGDTVIDDFTEASTTTRQFLEENEDFALSLLIGVIAFIVGLVLLIAIGSAK